MTTKSNTNTAVKAYSINEASVKLGMSVIYIRRMISLKKIQTTLVPVAENSKTVKHMITEDELNKWRASSSSRSRREDGRSKFTLYASAEEKEQIVALLESNKIEAKIERTNIVKKVATVIAE